ncbi:uncharacterized protein LOC107837782 [Poecilia formosa]|uniref:uncharacterized protein LOC107837782 n=1 Tax=Poecilia formosa TaxID=48698 RepID=UPI0007B8A20C|nr:PREDICTED: uncharacterized protein LOC107837782 [Poecilia formosa]
MSDAASEMVPETGTVKVEQQDGSAGQGEHVSSNKLQEEGAEGSGVTEKEAQTKMLSVFEQVRNQIKSRGGVKAPKSSILELVAKIKDIETATEQTNGQSGGNGVDAEEEKETEAGKIDCKDERDLRLETLSKMFEEKLEASKKLLRDEFEAQISAVRHETRAYTDQTLKDLECKMTSGPPGGLQPTRSKPQQEGADAETKRRASVAPSLASRRGKVLTRTLTTTLIPKTSAPIIISGSHGKSKSSPKGQSSLVRDHVLPLSGNKSHQGRSPLPPAQPLLHQRRKSIQAKCKTGN